MTEKVTEHPRDPVVDLTAETEHEKLREAAAEFLDQATKTNDPAVRAGLLAFAQKWLELADHNSWIRRFRALVGEFNDEQMRKD
ncbi:MAG TPA: hypothetical protein VFB45_10965 [Pseudolabrys sp.]|nr:hypothetical protein [Pseudolabrys sp.]